MTVTDVDEVLSDGTAVVEQPTDDSDTDQLRVRGVLIPEDAISEGLSGKPTRWPADVLEDAADREVFVGKPITVPPDWDPEQHVGVQKTDAGVSIDETITFEDKVGEIEATPYESGEGLLFEGFVADEYAEDLIARGLAQVSPVMMRSVEEADASDTDFEELYEAQQIGSVRDVGLVPDGGMPGNQIEAMSGFYAEALAQVFDERAESRAGAGQDGNEPAESGVDPTDDMTESTDDSLTDEEREVLRKLDRFDDPTVVEQSDAEVLSRADELLTAADDVDGDVEVVAKDEYEALNSHIETIDEELGSALQEQRDLKEATVEAMSFEAKVSEFKTDDGDLSLEALSQTPETGGSTDDEPEAFSASDLTQEERDEIESLAARAKTFDNIDEEHAEALRSEAAELAGAEEFDELEEAEVI